jgi:hypothetical protein
MRTRLAPLAVAIALCACSPALNPEQLDPYRDAPAACRSFFDAIFSFEARCGVAQAFAESMYDAAAFRCDDLGRSTVSQDTSGFQACVEALATTACWQDFDTVCQDLVVSGTVQEGGACAGDADCAPGLYDCHSPTNACGGTCRAYAAIDEPCINFDDPLCAEAAGLYCSSSTGTCRPRVAQGNGCVQTGDCQDGLRCMALAGPATCIPAEGVPCSVSQWCESSDGGYYCPVWDTTPLCRKLGSVPADATRCGGGKECPGDQWCDPAAFECRARTLDGACDDRGQCLDPAHCEKIGQATTGTCKVPVKVGGACVVGLAQCELGAACSGPGVAQAGTCRVWPKAGGTCGLLNGELVGCMDGWCKVPDGATVGTCSPYTKLGDACTSSDECGGGVDFGAYECVDRVCAKTCPL